MMKAKRIIAVAALTPLYWGLAVSVTLAVGYEVDFQCTRGAPIRHPCHMAMFMIPAMFLIFAYLYAWAIWVAARRVERAEAEASRLSII